MARLPYLQAHELAPADADLLARDLNLYRVLAHSPQGARAFAKPALYVRHDSPLDPRLRELAILQIGYLTKVRYEYAHHIEIGIDAGLSREDILAIALETRGERSHLGVLERAVLSTARQLAETLGVDDSTYAVLGDALAPDCLVDLIMIISTYCGVVRLLSAFEIDLEPGYEKYLDEFPLA